MANHHDQQYEQRVSRMAGYAAEGLTIREVAEIEGVTYQWVRVCCERAGVHLKPEINKTLRDKVGDMKPLEAVELLLRIIDAELALDDSEPMHPIEAELTGMQRKIFRLLWRKQGTPVPTDTVYDHLFCTSAPDKFPETHAVRVHMMNLRKKLPPSITITTLPRLGYRLDTHNDAALGS